MISSDILHVLSYNFILQFTYFAIQLLIVSMLNISKVQFIS